MRQSAIGWRSIISVATALLQMVIDFGAYVRLTFSHICDTLMKTALTTCGHMEKLLKKTRVAAYCRVSGRDEKRQDSLENQTVNYTEKIRSHPGWELCHVYMDYGISGYRKRRPGFDALLDACHLGKVDLIITKSISRFARNTLNLLTVTRELSALGVNIYFELQNIYTLSAEGELFLTLYGAFAQAESDSARRQTLMSIRQRYEAGEPTRRLEKCLGYKKLPSGEFAPDENAPLVVEIFSMAASGMSVYRITKYLNKKHIRTQNGKEFCRTGVTRILRNPSYMGDFVYQRYFVDDERRLVPNRGEKPMYRIENDHVPPVSRGVWEEVQRRLDEASERYRRKHTIKVDGNISAKGHR